MSNKTAYVFTQDEAKDLLTLRKEWLRKGNSLKAPAFNSDNSRAATMKDKGLYQGQYKVMTADLVVGWDGLKIF